MGFCRRCGDIVPSQATRCKCGGTPVAPANLWSKTSRSEPKDDKWSKTYTTPPRSRTSSAAPTPTKSPLTKSPYGAGVGVGVDDPSSSPTPISKINTSPLRGSQRLRDFENDLESPTDILISPEDATLAKVYGSILQPTSELPIHSCALCHEIFAPDATIYPDLSSESRSDSSFLCRSCFVILGGSKGKCKACHKDVLVATNEGAFVEFSGNVWHKRCFRCENCDLDMSHSPMVDIFGKPSCQGCFDTCTIRSRNPNKTPTKGSIKTPNKTPTKTPTKTPPRKLSEVTNNLGGVDRGSRECNPALEELSTRLGIPRTTPEPTKAVDDPFLTKLAESKLKSGTLAPVQIKASADSPRNSRIKELPGKPSEREASAINNDNNLFDTCCKGCSKPLLTRFGDGKFVNAPGEDGKPVSYHVQCFRCNICQKPIEGSRSTPFVRGAKGICHPECVDNERGRSRVAASPLRIIVPEHEPMQDVAKELQTAPAAPRIFPRFRDSETCPGCQKGVSIMEFGVVLGPQAKRWHKVCLVCGGKGAKLPRPGCGKVLDSSAKRDIDGAIWCRECLLLLPIEKRSSPQNSPIRDQLAPMHTGQVANHLTGGSTTIARQFTGNAVGLLRSGSISPIRQLRSVSPTKGLRPIGKYSGPIGARNKSVDKGRGMFLVRQMTGSSQR